MSSGFDLSETARRLLNIEVNTILRDNMTAEPMPPLPHALLDIAHEYADAICDLGLDLGAFFGADLAALPTIAPPWLEPATAFSGDQLVVSKETFDRLRWAADAVGRTAARRAVRLSVGQLNLSDRIQNNCDAIKLMFPRFGAAMAPFLGKNRGDVLAIPPPAGGIQVGVDDMIALQKMWDIGTEEIVAQTVVHLSGDVTARVRASLVGPGSENLFAIHRQSIDVSIKSWQYLLDAVREIAGATVRVLLGQGR